MLENKTCPFMDSFYKADPYPLYDQMRNQSPAYKTSLPSGVEVYVVTRYVDVLAALKDERLVKDIRHARPQEALKTNLGRATMLKADPPEHTRLRLLAQAAFTPRVVNQMRGHIQEITDRLLDAVAPLGCMDLINDFAFPLPITVITEMLGVPVSDQAKFREWSAAVIASGSLSSEEVKEAPELLPPLQYLSQLVAERRKSPREDLISRFIQAEVGGDHFTDREVIGTSSLLLIAGHETTVNLIGSGMLALLQNPEQFGKLKQDPARIRPAIEELLRFVNPVQWTNRFATVDLEISGVQIPKGSHLLLALSAANHDPAFAAAPDGLDVSHGDAAHGSDARHLAFGQGIHYCLGAPLARLEGEIAFTSLIQRFPNLSLADPAQKLDWRPGLELRGLNSLPVVF